MLEQGLLMFKAIIMKSVNTVCLFLLSLPLCANVQFVNEEKNDLEKMNLKGPVIQVIEEIYGVEEAFGEWKKGEKCLSRVSIFNNRGFLLFDTKAEEGLLGEITENISGVGRVPVIKSIEMYSYDQQGRIKEVSSVQSNPYSENKYLINYENIVPFYLDAGLNYSFIKQYDYNPDGTINAVTSMEDRSILEKEIYKYNDDGYEIWYYNRDGKRNTSKQYQVILSEHRIQKVKEAKAVWEIYNEKGQREALLWGLIASGGRVLSQEYYGYNEHGDLRVVTSNSELIQAIDGWKSLYPYVANQLNSDNDIVYEYEYDSHGNWTVRKAYSIRNQEVVVTGWRERKILYSDDNFDGESFCNSLVKDLQSKQKEEEEKHKQEEERRKLPMLSSVAKGFSQWLKSILSYPDESTTLGSILKESSSYLEFKIRVEVEASGKIRCSQSYPNEEVSYSRNHSGGWDMYRGNHDDSYRWYLCNYNYYSSLSNRAKKDKIKAPIEINNILAIIIEELNRAPIGKKGQYSHFIRIHIRYHSGVIDISIYDEK